MNERFQTLVYGTAIALMIGWVFYIGRGVFVPIMFSVFVVYVILGLARLIGKVPLLGPALPQLVISILSVLIIALGLAMVVYTVLANKDSVIAMAPRYQESLLAAVQRVAVLMRVEAEPTWTTLRRDLLAQVSLQRVAASALASVSSLFATVIVVALYACFLLVERSNLDVKILAIARSPEQAQRIKQVIADINARVGAYLALKTFLGVLLGALSYVIMRFAGLEFAGFWAVLIALLNYVPYIGSFLSVVLPGLMGVAQFGSAGEAIQIMMSLAVVQFVIGNFLDPYVMGNSLNLSPFAILVSLAVWVALWGVPGAFLAVPITAMMTIIFSEFPGTRPIAVLLSQNGKP
ncbi:AI-2E family transporter [Variovorax davisae]|uniref:AI-2E family transporter n=1 Tax=Variovorax davisae TaxID=3053515 RepID=UPI0025791008|nr:AI-2E family transporter [Variovorax sp. J22P271]